jgi:hypothetical protein
VERAEAKVFANRERYNIFLIMQPLRRANGKLLTFSGNYRDALRNQASTMSHIENKEEFRIPSCSVKNFRKKVFKSNVRILNV